MDTRLPHQSLMRYCSGISVAKLLTNIVTLNKIILYIINNNFFSNHFPERDFLVDRGKL